jgi:hypothetical protein
MLALKCKVLTRCSQVLYTGPMFQVYNTILRQFPKKEFVNFQQGGNLFSTTIFVLQSAVVRISREMRLPPSLQLFRGLGGKAELPDSFYVKNVNGCSGYTEYGFLSTTSHWETAVEYSGLSASTPLPMIIRTSVSSVDRGACIKDLSQYPTEVNPSSAYCILAHFHVLGTDAHGVQMEYIWPACSYIESSGPPYMVNAAGGLLTIMPVRINANGKSLSVIELCEQKKDMHISSFSYLLAEIDRDLERIAREGKVMERLENDRFRVKNQKQWISWGGNLDWLLPGMSDGENITFTLPGLLARISQQCRDVFENHKQLKPELFNDEQAYRHIVTEMIDTRAAAESTLHGYIEDPGIDIENLMRDTIKSRHRAYVAFLVRTLPVEAEARSTAAGRLCRIMGVMHEDGPNEFDADGFTPLMRAAAEGAGRRVLRCLVDARAHVDARDRVEDRTALYIAAEMGHADAVETLVQLRGDVNAASEPSEWDVTPIWIAAERGHLEVIEVLGKYNADVNRTSKDGSTPLFIAAQYGHTLVVEALLSLKADKSIAKNDGFTPLRIAKDQHYDAAVALLQQNHDGATL